MHYSLRLFIVVFNIFTADSGRLCENREHGCCSGQVWNETLEMCTDCTAGYTGKFCDIRCQYPYYGMQCLMKCDPPHSRDHYDFKTGCVHTDLTTFGKFMARTNTDEGSTNSFITEMYTPSKNQIDKAISSAFSPLQIVLIALSVVLFIILVMYLFLYKITKPEQPVESHSDKKNAHYEDVQDLGFYP
ncbi:uncharacterized protein LOC125676903 [Ostrea edulis]|uniref:uncharacterized protein LOC125676903 n=1 Tax=Ostrea edulis TaxID=37623 RepID=UPI0024AFFD10|nr:uncharacterized protein LOC125676903 [Ostrea edulis]